jgi:hypothetical protein
MLTGLFSRGITPGPNLPRLQDKAEPPREPVDMSAFHKLDREQRK